ncbi:MAG: hypothetical protein HRT89_03655 [Lentisphaeria bacterium]|nr:hypothetical protein [Lentisphaeria bacterium]
MIAAPPGASVMYKVCNLINLGMVPATIVLTLLVWKMWLIALFGTYYFGAALGASLPAIGVFLIIFFISLIIAFILTIATTWPIKKLFQKGVTYHGREHLIGGECVITSSGVDNSYGRAEVAIGGSPIIIDVVSDETFKKEDMARIVLYNKVKNTYTIETINKESGNGNILSEN